MHLPKKAFTLIELLVVLAIILVLAGVLFPVFASAKARAKSTHCLTNFRQVALASQMYISDYDETLMPVNHQLVDAPSSRNDRTWVQLLLPYGTSFAQFFCPSDHTHKSNVEATFDDDLVAGDADSRYYTASQRVNIGYNYLNLAPITKQRGTWQSQPRSVASLGNPSNTFMFLDSASMDPGTGGGSWLVVAPCRFVQEGGRFMDTFSDSDRAVEVSSPTPGWSLDNAGTPLSTGGVWAWHAEIVNAVNVDGSAAPLPKSKLAIGCDVRANWQGVITDTNTYAWDSR